MDSYYALEMTAKTRPAEIARAVGAIRRGASVEAPPSPMRRTIASAIVRFGIFLNGSAYHCPQAACER